MRIETVLDALIYNPFRHNIGEHYLSWDDITKPLEKVKGRHFVYCLMQKEEVVYVGRTSNLYSRLSYHKYRKKFDEIYLTEFANYVQCCIAESDAIMEYQPIYNINMCNHRRYNEIYKGGEQ